MILLDNENVRVRSACPNPTQLAHNVNLAHLEIKPERHVKCEEVTEPKQCWNQSFADDCLEQIGLETYGLKRQLASQEIFFPAKLIVNCAMNAEDIANKYAKSGCFLNVKTLAHEHEKVVEVSKPKDFKDKPD